MWPFIAASMSASVGLGLVRKQARGLHDLPRLAVAALGRIDRAPGRLQRVFARRVQPLDGDNGRAVERAHARLAGAHRAAADVHGAGAALGDAAAVLGAGERELVAQVPEERHRGVAVERTPCAVDCQCHGNSSAAHSARLVRPRAAAPLSVARPPHRAGAGLQGPFTASRTPRRCSPASRRRSRPSSSRCASCRRPTPWTAAW